MRNVEWTGIVAGLSSVLALLLIGFAMELCIFRRRRRSRARAQRFKSLRDSLHRDVRAAKASDEETKVAPDEDDESAASDETWSADADAEAFGAPSAASSAGAFASVRAESRGSGGGEDEVVLRIAL